MKGNKRGTACSLDTTPVFLLQMVKCMVIRIMICRVDIKENRSMRKFMKEIERGCNVHNCRYVDTEYKNRLKTGRRLNFPISQQQYPINNLSTTLIQYKTIISSTGKKRKHDFAAANRRSLSCLLYTSDAADD